LGWIAGIGALAIPGVGPFIAAGRIMAALSGAAIGAAVGGIAGGLIGLGIPEIEAKRYEGKIKEGNILISVHTENSADISHAKDIFTKAGAEDICVTGEASTPVPQKASDRPAVQTQAAFTGHGR
jgi:outer membrane lipoprotein SlyB